MGFVRHPILRGFTPIELRRGKPEDILRCWPWFKRSAERGIGDGARGREKGSRGVVFDLGFAFEWPYNAGANGYGCVVAVQQILKNSSLSATVKTAVLTKMTNNSNRENGP